MFGWIIITAFPKQKQQMVGEGSWCGSVATGRIQRVYDVHFLFLSAAQTLSLGTVTSVTLKYGAVQCSAAQRCA